jgi:hypothetical protein
MRSDGKFEFKIINMVVLHYKKTDSNQFLYETETSIKIDQLIYDLCESKLSILRKLRKMWPPH